jgi:RHS repeat-associated protein
VPCAKIENDNQYSIVADYLGTPTHAYDANGNEVWQREIDCYGSTRKLIGEKDFCPYLYQGQSVDLETGLAYNRFRYYDNESGNYISQDPIGLSGGNPTLYGYVKDTNNWVDQSGLDCKTTAKLQSHADAAKAEAQLSTKQQASVQRSLGRAEAAVDPKVKAYHEMMAAKKQRLYMGTQVDTRFKLKVDNDPDLADLSTTPRGKVGPDVYDPKEKKYWDLTTEKDWGKGTHQSKYDTDFGNGTGIFW